MNFWNIKYTKQRLAILQKAEAQKRHLIGLIKAKSVIAQQSKQSRYVKSANRSLSKSSPKKDNSFVKMQIRRNNNILFKKIANTQKLQNQKSLEKSNCKFINITKTLSKNHNMIYHIKKQMKQRQIDEQNTRIFARLIQTSPTIKRTEWIKKNIETAKYKQNMNRSKYAQPDYSVQACKLLNSKSSKYQLKFLRPNTNAQLSRITKLKESSVSNLRLRT